MHWLLVSPLTPAGLAIFERTFRTYQMSDPAAVALRAKCVAVEGSLNEARGKMALGYYTSAGVFVEKSSVQLRTLMRTGEGEAGRKAAWQGLRSIGACVCDNGFCELVKQRNRMAKKLGYVDFYDYKVRVPLVCGFGHSRQLELAVSAMTAN